MRVIIRRNDNRKSGAASAQEGDLHQGGSYTHLYRLNANPLAVARNDILPVGDDAQAGANRQRIRVREARVNLQYLLQRHPEAPRYRHRSLAFVHHHRVRVVPGLDCEKKRRGEKKKIVKQTPPQHWDS